MPVAGLERKAECAQVNAATERLGDVHDDDDDHDDDIKGVDGGRRRCHHPSRFLESRSTSGLTTFANPGAFYFVENINTSTGGSLFANFMVRHVTYLVDCDLFPAVGHLLAY
jgi:hypothetical protein